MGKIRIVRDMDECEQIWRMLYPKDGFFDLWEVRASFAAAYQRAPYFIVFESAGKPQGLLPLAYIEESDSYAFFPGETWHGKTWMEQNKIPAKNSRVLQAMIEVVPGTANIRYLSPHNNFDECFAGTFPRMVPDEIGYLFYPARHGYSFDNYLGTLSGKSRRKILSEVNKINEKGVEFTIDRLEDLEWLFRLNLENFGQESYFHDKRFQEAFWQLISWTHKQNMLRVVTLSVGGRIAAVDIGILYGRDCVLLAGGTHREFPGVAKVINLFHLEWACAQRMNSLDFLCGDFGWKERFRLNPRPLYQFNVNAKDAVTCESWSPRMDQYAA